MYQFTVTRDCVTITTAAGKTLSLRSGADNFAAARTKIINEDWAGIEDLFLPGKPLLSWLGEGFTYADGIISYKGEPIHGGLSARMLKMSEEGRSPKPLMRFWARLQNNPSMRSVNQLWPFLDHKGIPITEDGFFLAYKAVRQDWLDAYSGRILNTVGKTIEMPRNKISDDPKEACHFGLHVGALEYAKNYGPSDRRILICKVDPADVVCVPYDESNMKMRTCKYVVLAEHKDGSHLPSTYMDTKTLAPEPVSAPVPEPEPVFTPEPVAAPVPEPVSAPAPTPATQDAQYSDLLAMPLDALRKYAKSCGLKNPGKILGGKQALAKTLMGFLTGLES